MTTQAPNDPLVPTTKHELQVRIGGYSTEGKKASNQDAFAANLPQNSSRYYKGITACIADGLSSSDTSQTASQTTVSQFISDYYCTPDTWSCKTAGARILSALNRWLYHHNKVSHARQDGYVTTFTSFIIKSNTAHIFHIGDSRLYLLRNQKLEQLTQDHCYYQGEKALLSRALGTTDFAEVDYIEESLQPGDFLILTTDGVHESPSFKTSIIDELKSYDNLEACAKQLVTQAINEGSEDNATCLIVAIDELPHESINEAHQRLTQLPFPPVFDVGQKVDDYTITRVIHHGTRSHVYHVLSNSTQKPYIIKSPSENFIDDEQYLESFVREGWVGQRVQHNNVMRIYPPESSRSFLYHCCEYVEGQTLRQWLNDHDGGKTALLDVRKIAQQLTAGVRALQRKGMVHRDLKPENIILQANGYIKIIDLGTVAVDGLGEVASQHDFESIPVGDIAYLAPEYLVGAANADHQSDIFSIGIIIYELLSGHLPYPMHEIARKYRHTNKPIINTQAWSYTSIRNYRPDLPRWVDAALEKATQAHRSKRYTALSEFMHDLEQPKAHSQKNSLANKPLLESNPVLFWQGLSAMLFIALILSLSLHLS